MHPLAQHKLFEKATNDQEIFVMPDGLAVLQLARDGGYYAELGKSGQLRRWACAQHLLRAETVVHLRESLANWQASVGCRASVAFHKDAGGKAMRGNGSFGMDYISVLQWVESKAKVSVLFISFGSIALTQMRYLVEIGFRLEASG